MLTELAFFRIRRDNIVITVKADYLYIVAFQATCERPEYINLPIPE